MPSRRDFHRLGTFLLGGLMTLALAVPGMAYLIDPLRRKSRTGDFRPLAKLSELEVGKPKQFQIVEEREDAWVKYPKEPVGAVWLVRQEKGKTPEVIAFTAECPHLGCAVNLTPSGNEFLCPCHTSAFDKTGKALNKVPPRGMDTLEVAPLEGDDPTVKVRFQRFQSQSEEKKPLV